MAKARNRDRNRGRNKNNRRGSRPQPRVHYPPVKRGPFEGILERNEKGDSFLRDLTRHLRERPEDPIVPVAMLQKHSLRGGELINGEIGPNGKSGRAGLMQIEKIEGVPAEEWSPAGELQDSIAIDPHELLKFATDGGPKSMWMVQLFTPIGRGQRGLIVSPPRTGKTILLQQMAHGIAENHPDVHMIVLLIDERPEEVTEMRRNVRGDVIASSSDESTESHVRVARLVTQRARRLVERGQDVVVLLDSITRLARAFNNFIRSSGRTMTGGLDIRALEEPKKIFGSARAIEDGGTLTIIGTALIDTGSRADNFIFEEFKGTGNMELLLDREMANLRVWPAMDLQQSGTRKEEKLLDETTLAKVIRLRRQIHNIPPMKAMEMLLEKSERFDTLDKFLDSIQA